MRNRHQILNQLLLGRKRLRVHHHQLCLMSLAQMSQQLVAKSHQSILMSEHHSFHFSRDDAIHQPEKLFTLKIESSPNLEHPLIHLDGWWIASSREKWN